MKMNIDNAKSYATEANLIAALTKLGFATDRFVVVRNREGRFTAIFPASAADGYLGRFASAGFLTLG
jgi:hypothetical protein